MVSTRDFAILSYSSRGLRSAIVYTVGIWTLEAHTTYQFLGARQMVNPPCAVPGDDAPRACLFVPKTRVNRQGGGIGTPHTLIG